MQRIIDDERRTNAELQDELREQKEISQRHLEEKDKMEDTLNEFKGGNIYNILEKGEFLNNFLSNRSTKIMQQFKIFTMDVKDQQIKGYIDAEISDCIE